MTLYGYARVSVREPEDKNLDLQVERLVRAGCSMGNIRAEEACGAKDDRGGLLELLDLVVTHIDRLSKALAPEVLGNNQLPRMAWVPPILEQVARNRPPPSRRPATGLRLSPDKATPARTRGGASGPRGRHSGLLP